MANIGLNKHLSQEKIPVIFIKRKVFITFENVTGNNLKIEIPISKITGATYNKDNRVNKLVTVFAFTPAIWIGQQLMANPDTRQCSKQIAETGDKNWLAFELLPRHCATALNEVHCNGDNNQLAFEPCTATTHCANQVHNLRQKHAPCFAPLRL